MDYYFDSATYLYLLGVLQEEPDLASEFAGYFNFLDGNYYVNDYDDYYNWITNLIEDDDPLLGDFLNWSHTQGGLSTMGGGTN